jgi:acyl-CoA synthetase (AMP-forming)/AMP-acid ligase II
MRTRQPTILDLLADALHESTVVRFVGDRPRTGAELWRAAGTAADWLGARVGSSGSVAAVFDTSFACVAAALGAWRAGVRLGSLPALARKADVAAYRATVASLARALDADLVLAGPDAVSTLAGIGVDVAGFEQCASGGPPVRAAGTPSFVQFSSGTTARPKGIELTLEAMAANVDGIVSRIAHDDPVVCSWLPLSHDMGFVGTLLAGLAFGQQGIAGRTEVVFMAPSAFLMRPARFLAACDEFGATATSMPSFALDLLARRPPSRSLDLSRLQVCIVGAEPIRARTLRSFTAALEPHRLDPLALCPAYGLAEATLAVTLVSPAEHWHSTVVATEALGRGRWAPTDHLGQEELVGLGRPLPDVELRVDGAPDGIGHLSVRSPSLLSGYVGAGSPLDDGWLVTTDLGHREDDELYVAGRTDDLMFLADRSLYASSLEEVIDASPAIRGHAGTAIPDGDGRYVVIAERRRGTRAVPALPDVARDLRTALLDRFGVGPSAVVFVGRGQLPRTASGKLQRNLLARRLAAGELDVEMRRDFRGPR